MVLLELFELFGGRLEDLVVEVMGVHYTYQLQDRVLDQVLAHEWIVISIVKCMDVPHVDGYFRDLSYLPCLELRLLGC